MHAGIFENYYLDKFTWPFGTCTTKTDTKRHTVQSSTMHAEKQCAMCVGGVCHLECEASIRNSLDGRCKLEHPCGAGCRGNRLILLLLCVCVGGGGGGGDKGRS